MIDIFKVRANTNNLRSLQRNYEIWNSNSSAQKS